MLIYERVTRKKLARVIFGSQKGEKIHSDDPNAVVKNYPLLGLKKKEFFLFHW